MSQLQTKFVDKVVSGKGHLIHKFRAKDSTGKQAYYFVLIEPRKELVFQHALQSCKDTLNFEDYGVVIASCYGDKPNNEVKDLLKKRYGFDVQ